MMDLDISILEASCLPNGSQHFPDLKESYLRSMPFRKVRTGRGRVSQSVCFNVTAILDSVQDGQSSEK